MKNSYEEHDCMDKNESACEEELEEDGISLEEAEEYFGE